MILEQSLWQVQPALLTLSVKVLSIQTEQTTQKVRMKTMVDEKNIPEVEEELSAEALEELSNNKGEDE